jgi:protein-(glutamine-N5) methyltransferase, release factor-specific
MNTYKELLFSARKYLKEHEITDADVDAWFLLSHVFQISRTDYIVNESQIAEEAKVLQFQQMIELRAKHIPLQHITGSQEFMGLEFEVTPDVLIPRQDTEILVEEVLKVCKGKEVIDMCTGSGCIIISVGKLGNPSKAVGVDVSPKALEVAIRNSVKQEVSIEFVQSNLFEQVDGTFDIIVSNPPYIPTLVIESLMPEVRDHEPLIALDGSKDGLYFYQQITTALERYLRNGGMIFYEIGYDQGEGVKQILMKEGFVDIRVKKDLSGLDRVVSARKP